MDLLTFARVSAVFGAFQLPCGTPGGWLADLEVVHGLARVESASAYGCLFAPGMSVWVVIFRIRVDSGDPLTGTICRDGTQPERFIGWLGLLRLLGDAVGSQAVFTGAVGELPSRSQPELGEDMGDVGLDCPSRDE
jgi:hypothetical protein